MARRCPQCATSFADEIFFCGYDGTITVQEQDPHDHDPRLGGTLGTYRVVARVADGAMGRVYEGRHPETKARVAIKVLHADVAKDAVATERFRREFETAQELDHPHVVKVLEFGETADRSLFLTMEYLEGEELGRALRNGGAQRADRLVRVMSQVCLALAHAHSYGVIHRDLKPDNIFLCRAPGGDSAKVLDFGSVKLQVETGPKLTAFGTTLGSPYYMSPEQAMGKLDVDQRTDVFALAAIMHEMATGKVAFEGRSVAEIMMKIVRYDPPPPSASNPAYPASFDAVILRGLSKRKEDRPATTVELAREVLAAFGLEGGAEVWATTDQVEIARALSATQPPAPPASFSPVAPAQVTQQPLPPTPSEAPPRPSGLRLGPLLAVGLAALFFTLGVAAVVLLR